MNMVVEKQSLTLAIMKRRLQPTLKGSAWELKSVKLSKPTEVFPENPQKKGKPLRSSNQNKGLWCLEGAKEKKIGLEIYPKFKEKKRDNSF